MRTTRFAAAIDFDGTIAETDFPIIIQPIPEALQFIAECRSRGVAVILWTCRTGWQLDDALVWCSQNRIRFDAVNCNLDDWQDNFRRLFPDVPTDCRKISADIHIDDKNAGGVNWAAAFEWVRAL